MRFREITGGLSFLKNVAGKKQLCYPAANIFVDHWYCVRKSTSLFKISYACTKVDGIGVRAYARTRVCPGLIKMLKDFCFSVARTLQQE